VDTGAITSLINEKTARDLKLELTPLKHNESPALFSASGSKIVITGTAQIRIYLSGLVIFQTVKVSPNIQHPLLLGVDFLSANSAVINYKLGILSLKDDLVTVPLHSKSDAQNCVTAIKTVCIPAYSEAIIAVYSPSHFNNKTVLLETLPAVQFNKFAVAKALVRCNNNKTVCRVLNFNPYVLTLRRGTKLAKIENLDAISSINKYNKVTELKSQGVTTNQVRKSCEELDTFLKDYGFKINPALDSSKRYELLQLLYDHKSVFARNLSEIKACKGYELKIDVHTNRKMYKRQFRLSEEDKKEASRQISEMIDAQVIEPSDTADFNSPIFLVKKRDNTRRLVVDLRGINSLIILKLLQLPRIDELLESIILRQPTYLTVCDIRSAFWQLPIEENSRKYTSFCGPDGRRWRFKRCPFGLSSSPCALIQVISNLFADKNLYHELSIYMDDILVSSNDWKSHLQQLELTLETLEDNHLSVNPRKTELAFSEVNYLGYNISAKGLTINDKRIEAIKHLKPPTNVKGLQRFLGLINFWRRHVRGMAQNTYNMRQLLKKGTPFIWSEKCQKEFTYLKDCLMKNPILRAIDPRKPIIIQTDGSTFGFGWAILQQDHNGTLYVTSYGAKSTTPAQQKYTCDELEAIALIYALKSIEPIAIHNQIVAVTDNSHLLHLHTWRPINSRQKRMLLYLMQYNLSIRFIKGARNLMADCLSRVFQDASAQERKDYAPVLSQEDEDFILAVSTRSSTRQQQLLTGDDSQDSQDNQTNTEVQTNTNLDLEVSAPELTPETDLCEDSDDDLKGQDDSSPDGNLITLPAITGADYENDSEFQYMYRYLTSGELSGDDKIDRTTLLLGDQFFVENGVLYRLQTPRRKSLARLRPLVQRLCIPNKFRHELIKFAHDNCGHFATQRLFLTLSAKAYWKNLFGDVQEFCNTCETCLRSKRNFAHRTVPLSPVPPARMPCTVWAMDHKPLSRKTAAGNTAILVFVDTFSSWPIFVPVPDQTAEVTARAFVQHVVATFGAPESLLSDKAAGYMSVFFSHVAKLLGVKHRTSATLTARSNGAAEAMVKRLIEMLKIYGDDSDIFLEDKLPLIHMSLRATAHSRLELTPYECMFGRVMPLQAPGEVPPSLPFSGDKETYYLWLAKELKRLHSAVKERREEVKKQDKLAYDKANRVVEPQWTIGNRVLLHDIRVKPNSTRVLTNKPYHGPFIIQDIVQKTPGIGRAYRLVREKDGKPLKYLVTSDRLKAFNTDRTEFNTRLPRLLQNENVGLTDNDNGQSQQLVPKSKDTSIEINQGFEPALEILQDRQIRGGRQYLVKFADSSIHWADRVSPALLRHYRSRKIGPKAGSRRRDE